MNATHPKSISVANLHDQTLALVERAMRDPEQPIVVEKHGKAAVVLVDARYFEGLLETLDLLSDPVAMKQLRQGREDERAGRLIPHEQVLKEFGLHGKASCRSSVDRKRKKRPARNR